MAEGGGDGSGFGIGDGAIADIHAQDADCAEIGAFDHGVDAHDRHHPPAHISFDYVSPSTGPLGVADVIEGPRWDVSLPRSAQVRANRDGFWTRFVRSIAFWR